MPALAPASDAYLRRMIARAQNASLAAWFPGKEPTSVILPSTMWTTWTVMSSRSDRPAPADTGKGDGVAVVREDIVDLGRERGVSVLREESEDRLPASMVT